jgi:hypothetical protein
MQITLKDFQIEYCRELFRLANKSHSNRCNRARVELLITQLAMTVASDVEREMYAPQRKRADEQRRKASEAQSENESRRTH